MAENVPASPVKDDLPKIPNPLQSEIIGFDPKKLSHADTKEPEPVSPAGRRYGN